MTQARTAAGHANAAARDLSGATRHAAYAAGQAAAVAHVAAHELGAAACAIKAAHAAAPEGEGERAGRLECRWQRDQLPETIRELVLDDQRLRNDICGRSSTADPGRFPGPLGAAGLHGLDPPDVERWIKTPGVTVVTSKRLDESGDHVERARGPPPVFGAPAEATVRPIT